MKRQKLYLPRIPWWTWDFGYDLPPNKGIRKKIYNRIRRRIGNRDLKKQLKEVENE